MLRLLNITSFPKYIWAKILDYCVSNITPEMTPKTPKFGRTVLWKTIAVMSICCLFPNGQGFFCKPDPHAFCGLPACHYVKLFMCGMDAPILGAQGKQGNCRHVVDEWQGWYAMRHDDTVAAAKNVGPSLNGCTALFPGHGRQSSAMGFELRDLHPIS